MVSTVLGVRAAAERISSCCCGCALLAGVGAFSELSVSDLVAALRQIEWEEPECVRLYVSEHDGRFNRIDWQTT